MKLFRMTRLLHLGLVPDRHPSLLLRTVPDLAPNPRTGHSGPLLARSYPAQLLKPSYDQRLIVRTFTQLATNCVGNCYFVRRI